MNQERLSILKMLEEGKISAAEAERLLRAVGDSGEAGAKKDSNPDFFDSVSEGLSRAFQVVQEVDVGKFVGEVVGEVSETVAGLASTGAKEQVVKEREYVLDGAAVSRLRAETANGRIVARAAAGEQVRVKVSKKVKAPDRVAAEQFVSQIAVEVEQVGDEIRVYREYPKPPRGVQVEVAYDIECPARLDLSLHSLNGKVEMDGVGGRVEAVSANGDIELAGGKGRIQARTKNGRVRARVDELAEEGVFSSANGKVEVVIGAGDAPLEAKTLNGSVDLTLPEDFNGRVEAQTTNGRAVSDFPILVSGKVRKNRLEGPIGQGGDNLVKLRTLNGNISLKKLS
ncbi:MAG: hypothetical protein GKR89_29700 [Candidatus Latescibacteria bacterium]|nr:hypothetical protein [Candidatus Latescibacterota bacterium]